MKQTKILSCLSFSIFFLAIDAEAAVRTRAQARALTSDLPVSRVELIQQFGMGSVYPQASIDLLKGELESCGITYNGTKCLDTQFENYGSAGVKDVDTVDKSGYIFFSRFKMKKDPRILLMAVVANKSDCRSLPTDYTKCAVDPRTKKPIPQKAFRTGNIWAIEPGRDKPDIYIKDFLECSKDEANCKLRPLLAYDPVEASREESALLDLEGQSPYALNAKRFYHAAVEAAEIKTPTNRARAIFALTNRSQILTASTNEVYKLTFLSLLNSKYGGETQLLLKAAGELLKNAAPGSWLEARSALTLASNGDSSPAIKNLLLARGVDARLTSDLRKELIAAYAKLASSPAEKDKLVELLGSPDGVLRSAAYSALSQMTLGEENLTTISKLLVSPKVNVRGNAVRALSRVSGVAALEKMVSMIMDADIDVSLAAANYAKGMLESLMSLSPRNFITLLENSTIKAVVSRADQRKLNELLIPTRKAILSSAFEKSLGQEEELFFLLNKSLKNPLASVRVEAISFIGLLNRPEAVATLIALLNDKDLSVSAEVVRVLEQKMLTDEHIDLLYRMAMDKNPLARQKAVRLIGRITTQKSLQALLLKSQEYMDASSKLIRTEVATILGSFYVAEATERLVAMLNDEAIEVRNAAFAPLSRGDRLISEKQTRQLIIYLQSPFADVPMKVTQLLSLIKSPLAIEAMMNLVSANASVELRLIAVDAIAEVYTAEATTLLLKVLLDSNAVLREKANLALSQRLIGEQELLSLSAGLSYADPSIRLVVASYLARSSSVEVLELLKKALEVEVDAMVAAGLEAAIVEVSSRTTL